jgi:hypothetical protein
LLEDAFEHQAQIGYSTRDALSPGTFVVKSGMALDCDGNLNRASAIDGRNMCDRFAGRSTASTNTHRRSSRPSSRPAWCSWSHS